mmetsp:Transcript_2586/g.3695  ORF Transcript_2586/g.3695 Transcript_2586/m.3695 type:complete len:115 (-) Transcript_2586:717-1061(-)
MFIIQVDSTKGIVNIFLYLTLGIIPPPPLLVVVAPSMDRVTATSITSSSMTDSARLTTGGCGDEKVGISWCVVLCCCMDGTVTTLVANFASISLACEKLGREEDGGGDDDPITT